MDISMKPNSIWVVALLIFCLGAATAAADPYIHTDDFNIETADDVDAAVESIRASLEAQGLTIVAVIDHAANAAGVGLDLRPTRLILFSNPFIDARLIRRSRTAGIDVPQKFLVWEDESGAIRLSYNATGYLADRHAIRLRDGIFRKNEAVLSKFGALPNGLITIDSEQSVVDTVAALTRVLEDAGFFIPLVIDHGAETARNHKRLRPTQLIIFGNPNVGTQLMQVNQAIGLDLPQKFLVWEDRDGQVHITYNAPAFLASRHDIVGLDTLVGNIATALRNFAEAGAAGGE